MAHLLSESAGALQSPQVARKGSQGKKPRVSGTMENYDETKGCKCSARE
jgi:hypothetical protein